MSLFEGKDILITGGTGTFGKKFVDYLLNACSPRRVIIYSRDEMKQWDMSLQYTDDRLRYFIGDVRDKDRLRRAFDGVHYVVHAAATKIVPIAEYNPFECVKTNVLGAMNVIDCALDAGVKKVVALSTDKACSPSNLYGATKLCSDKLFISGNAYGGDSGCRFSVVRYGNVMGSRGSVIPLFYSLKDHGVLPITDTKMTRFMISINDGIELVLKAFEDSSGGEIFVKKTPSMKITDVAKAIAPDADIEITGIRPGEKMHEVMIDEVDSRYTRDYGNYYKIFPQYLDDGSTCPENLKGGMPVPEGFVYSSDQNSDWLSVDDLRKWMDLNPYARQKI